MWVLLLKLNVGHEEPEDKITLAHKVQLANEKM